MYKANAQLQCLFDVLNYFRHEVNTVFAANIVRVSGVSKEVNLHFVVDASLEEIDIVLHDHNIIVHAVNHE